MAETTIAPGAPGANNPHHQILSDTVQAWQAALDIYRAAAARVEQFHATQLKPAYTDESLAFAQVSELEDQADRISSARMDRLFELVAIPAPDLPALLEKMEYSYRDYLVCEESARAVVRELIADAKRLF
jgi:hypothetical protein